MMNTNVGGIDKSVRIVAGIAIISWGVMAENWLGAIGIIPILTGVINFCPAYSLLGLNTKK